MYYFYDTPSMYTPLFTLDYAYLVVGIQLISGDTSWLVVRKGRGQTHPITIGYGVSRPALQDAIVYKFSAILGELSSYAWDSHAWIKVDDPVILSWLQSTGVVEPRQLSSYPYETLEEIAIWRGRLLLDRQLVQVQRAADYPVWRARDIDFTINDAHLGEAQAQKWYNQSLPSDHTNDVATAEDSSVVPKDEEIQLMPEKIKWQHNDHAGMDQAFLNMCGAYLVLGVSANGESSRWLLRVKAHKERDPGSDPTIANDLLVVGKKGYDCFALDDAGQWEAEPLSPDFAGWLQRHRTAVHDRSDSVAYVQDSPYGEEVVWRGRIVLDAILEENDELSNYPSWAFSYYKFKFATQGSVDVHVANRPRQPLQRRVSSCLRDTDALEKEVVAPSKKPEPAAPVVPVAPVAPAKLQPKLQPVEVPMTTSSSFTSQAMSEARDGLQQGRSMRVVLGMADDMAEIINSVVPGFSALYKNNETVRQLLQVATPYGMGVAISAGLFSYGDEGRQVCLRALKAASASVAGPLLLKVQDKVDAMMTKAIQQDQEGARPARAE